MPPARQIRFDVVLTGGARCRMVATGLAGWARCVKNRKGRVRWGMAVMDRRDGVENGLVGNGLMWQLGWGTFGLRSVWSEVVWHGSHGVVGCGRFVHGSVRYGSV